MRRTRESDARFVQRVYRELLDRPPDPGGLSEATRKLGAGLLRRALLAAEIRASAEYGVLRRTREWLQNAPAPEDARTLAGNAPDEIWLELTTRCNIVPACSMCGYAGDQAGASRGDMDPSIWRSLLAVLRGAGRIGLHGSGEPLLYPHLFDLLGALRGSRAITGFNTNGHLLGETTRRRLVEEGLGWISISVDAATPGTYLRIRRRRDLDVLVSRIRALREVRDALGSRTPVIEINMTVMRLNLGEVPAFVDLASAMGLDRVMFQQIGPSPASQRVVAPDGFVFDYREQDLAGEGGYDEVMEDARRRAAAAGLGFSCDIRYAPPAPRVVPAAAVCREPWNRLLFRVGGDAYVCCFQMMNRIAVGQLPRDPFEEIWNGRRMRLVREAMFTSAAPDCCRGCFVTYGRDPATSSSADPPTRRTARR